MSKFARLPSLISSVAELPDSQLLPVTGKLLAVQFKSCVGSGSTFIHYSSTHFTVPRGN